MVPRPILKGGNMQNSILITNNDKLTTLIGIVNDHAPLMVKALYAYMKKAQCEMWAAHCMGEDESAAAFMVDTLKDMIQISLSQNVANEIDSRYSMALEYLAQAQYLMLDIDEQNDQDAFWEQEDAQSAFDDRLAMYQNEY